MSPRALAVAIVAGVVVAAAGVYGRAAPDARPATAAPYGLCGSERWSVKTLTDPAASTIAFANAKPTSVEAMRHLKVPYRLKATSLRRAGAERTVYRVTAKLEAMKREDDSDIHLVVTDPAHGGSMIVEFPASYCDVGASSAVRARMTKARSDLAKACGGEARSGFVQLSGTATITGVGFFDLLHGQAGVAPNGIELHPALSFSSANCRRLTG
jgi:hypothetical protein